MKQLVKRINSVFVQIVLFFFYFFAIGLGFLLQKLFGLFSFGKAKDTYWIEAETDYKTGYFESPY